MENYILHHRFQSAQFTPVNFPTTAIPGTYTTGWIDIIDNIYIYMYVQNIRGKGLYRVFSIRTVLREPVHVPCSKGHYENDH